MLELNASKLVMGIDHAKGNVRKVGVMLEKSK